MTMLTSGKDFILTEEGQDFYSIEPEDLRPSDELYIAMALKQDEEHENTGLYGIVHMAPKFEYTLESLLRFRDANNEFIEKNPKSSIIGFGVVKITDRTENMAVGMNVDTGEYYDVDIGFRSISLSEH